MACVFLDFDDTLSDEARFSIQFVKALGRTLGEKYGCASEEAWRDGVVTMLLHIVQDYAEHFRGRPQNGYCAWLDRMRPMATEVLFERMNLPRPPASHEESIEIQARALQQCNALFGGAEHALHMLRCAGHRVLMASGHESRYLQAALQGAAVHTYPEQFFGPDLVDCAKEGPEYFACIFAAANVSPQEAIVVDDLPEAIGWALETGASAIQSCLSPVRRYPPVPGVSNVLTDLYRLPDIVESLAARNVS